MCVAICIPSLGVGLSNIAEQNITFTSNSSPTYRIIESFEAIVVALLLDENFGSQSLSFQGDDVALLAERVIINASSWVKLSHYNPTIYL